MNRRFSVISNLYFIAMWLFVAAAAILVLGDFWRGLGTASALSMFYITRMYYTIESTEYRRTAYLNSLKEQGINDESDEA